MKTIMKTKVKTKTIAAIALITLAAGSVVFGLTFISKKTGQRLSGNPYAGTTSQTGTSDPALVGSPIDVNDNTTTAPKTNAEAPAIQPVSINEEISCITKSADGLITNTGYAKKQNGAIYHRAVIDTPNGYNGSPCHNDSGWKIITSDRGVITARCSVKTGGGYYIATNQVSKTIGGIKAEGTAWQKTGPRKTVCNAYWPDVNCAQATTYAKYSNGPCVKYASSCDVPAGMSIVDASECPASNL